MPPQAALAEGIGEPVYNAPMTLVDQFAAVDLDLIARFVASREQERLQLEFKELRGGPSLSRDDRRNLAIAVSGFANSAGGLVIWGISARKNADGIDAAECHRPIRDPAVVLSLLESLTGQATAPIVEGVQHRTIVTAEATGYVVTLIPASDGGPHMALLGEQRFYKRSGDSFYRMEHYDIADMFAKRRKPDLRVVGKIRATGHAGPSIQMEAVLALENRGRGIAQFPSLQIEIEHPLFVVAGYGLSGSGQHGLRLFPGSSPDGKQGHFVGGVDDVVHPGISLPVTKITATVERRNLPPADLTVKYTLGAMDVPVRRGALSYTHDRLRDVGSLETLLRDDAIQPAP